MMLTRVLTSYFLVLGFDTCVGIYVLKMYNAQGDN